MSTRRQFTCNLCGCGLSEFGNNEASFARHGVGIFFDSGLRFRLLTDAENHLCNECLEGVWKARQEQKTETRK